MNARRIVHGLMPIVVALAGRPEAMFGQGAFELERIATGLNQPLLVTHAGDGSGRLFVVEQVGRIRVLSGDRVLDQPFLDLTAEVRAGGEQGLLGLAFHPLYEENGLFFVNYTDRGGDTVISRFSVSADSNRADSSSEVEVLSYRQPASNHNGGHLAFGPDGFLYIASGDGGGSGDPQNNGQSRDSFLGKLLRIDVDGSPYSVPPDNPFVGSGNSKPEIWAYGLRNPWRFSFDRKTGDLFIGDVGQSREEEIDFQPAGSSGGENYGWRRKEGSLCFDPATGCDDPSFTDPILVYSHGPHCSVTAGYRYRGRSHEALAGVFVFGDFCSGVIWGAELRPGGVWSAAVLADTNLSISSFGEDEEGELLVVDRGGAIYRVAGSALLLDDFETGDTSVWRKTKGKVSVVEPGLRGSGYALEVQVDGSGTESVVTSSAPKREESLSVRFLLDPDLVDLGGEEVDILHLVGGAGTLHVRMTLAPKGGRYQVRLWAALSDGQEILVGKVKIRKRGATRIGFDWVQAESVGADNGLASLFKGRRSRAETMGLATDSAPIRSLEIGLPAGSRGAVGGPLLFDDVVVAR